MLAKLEDIRAYIAEDKLPVDDVNTSKLQLEVARLIKGKLSGVFQATTIFSWDEPDNTPGIIRNIAGELIAAFLYRERYSEDDTEVPEYARQLYMEAIGLLDEIRAGTLVVLDENDEPIEDNLLEMSAADFWPNDSTPGPYFQMEQKL